MKHRVNIFINFCLIGLLRVVISSVVEDDINKIKTFFDSSKSKNKKPNKEVNESVFEIQALSLSEPIIIGDFEDNPMKIKCPFGKNKLDYFYIKWFIDGKRVSSRQLRNRTQLRMNFEKNKILIKYLKLEDSALYSCQLRRKSNTTVQELALNSTNFKLKVYPFFKGGLDFRSPKVMVKLVLLITFLIFCAMLFQSSKVYQQFR